jgi:hypothetical protein
MNAEFRLQQSRVYGNRTVIPVVSDTTVCHGHGVFASVRPVALLIGEDGEWEIVLLEGDSVEAVMKNLVMPG